MKSLLTSFLLTAALTTTVLSAADAQSTPQRFQLPNQVQSVPTVSREALAAAEEEAQETPSSYTATCREIEDLLVGQFRILLECRQADEYGARHYVVRPGSYDRETPQENSQRWFATRFIEAVQYAGANPDVDLTLTVIPSERYGNIVDSFTLSYRD